MGGGLASFLLQGAGAGHVHLLASGRRTGGEPGPPVRGTSRPED